MLLGSWLDKTMMVERLIGVISYYLIVAYGYIGIRQASNWKRINTVLNTVVVLLCLLAFFYIPSETADLYRWRYISDDWKSISFNTWVNDYFIDSTTPLSYLLFYIVAKLGIPGLLPAVACFVFHYLVFYILKNEAKYNYSAISISTAFLCLMSQGLFLGVISGIRNGMAFAIISYCVYKDLVMKQKSPLYLILCLIAILIHIASIPAVALYLGFAVVDSTSNRDYKRLFAVLLTMVGLIAISYRFRNNLIEVVMDKVEYYTSASAYSNIWEYLVGILCLIIIISVLWLFRFDYKKEKLIGLYSMNLILVILELLFFRSFSVFHRFLAFNYILTMPILIRFFSNHKDKQGQTLISLFTAIAFLIVLIESVRGDLCGFKYCIIG